MLTEQTLGITLADGEEVDGFEVGGLWVAEFPEAGQPVAPVELWPAGTRVESWRMHGPGWVAPLWRFQLQSWPESTLWRGLVEQTLARMADRGAAIAWMANDHTFADPPGLFDQNVMGNMVFAALSKATGFVCLTELGEPVTWLPASTQELLRTEAALLIDHGKADPDEGE